MCYTGQCPYEWTSGESVGGCKLKYGDPYPDDAACIMADKLIDEYERKHPIKTLKQRLTHRWWLWRMRKSGNEVPF